MLNNKIAFAMLATVAAGALSTAIPAQAKDSAYKAANRAAIQMWLQQQAGNGVYFNSPQEAQSALMYQQQTGRPLYDPYAQYYNNNNRGYYFGSANPYQYNQFNQYNPYY